MTPMINESLAAYIGFCRLVRLKFEPDFERVEGGMFPNQGKNVSTGFKKNRKYCFVVGF